jgi:hypothetical protein
MNGNGEGPRPQSDLRPDTAVAAVDFDNLPAAPTSLAPVTRRTNCRCACRAGFDARASSARRMYLVSTRQLFRRGKQASATEASLEP